MKIQKWIAGIAATVLLSGGSIALAQAKGHGKGHDKHGDDEQGRGATCVLPYSPH